MPSPHLTTGSQQPPKTEGKLRLYSMEFCPYAQRARLVLKAKNIPHDIVNINLIKKPEWYTKIHPEGKVPALDTGSKIIVESLDIANFLDAEYPDNPLCKPGDKELIQKIAPITDLFYQCLAKTENKSLEEWAQAFAPHLAVFESELEARKSTFFGGEKPGMVDYMLWPWGERAGTIAIAHGAQLPFASDQFPRLRKWRKAMREDKVCSEIYNGPEKFWKCVEMKLKNLPPDYDSI
ncbi:pyrimidodiazepine synthase-like [Tribolium madens]|uniref:pyrimidodiazepine synthase-like n=1 Tax=Tribolium madens TaxID=41895 RepID=UPI001CF731E3|nr:pyrimidodiazepine synthase-like [Tribolium madens]